MVQIPMSFQGRKVPINSQQWMALYLLLCREIQANPIAQQNRRIFTPKSMIKNGITWDVWFRSFMQREDVNQILSKDATAEMWMTNSGRETYILLLLFHYLIV